MFTFISNYKNINVGYKNVLNNNKWFEFLAYLDGDRRVIYE